MEIVSSCSSSFVGHGTGVLYVLAVHERCHTRCEWEVLAYIHAVWMWGLTVKKRGDLEDK